MQNYELFKVAYNDFDSRALSGERLRRFYVDDFTRPYVEKIETAVRITGPHQKLLVVGHRGCGKSTILHKVQENLDDEYHVVIFSVADILNIMDVEAVDILLAMYLQVLDSVREADFFNELFNKFKNLSDLFSTKIHLEEVNANLLKVLSFKFTVEPESRATVRRELVNQVQLMQENISEACQKIQQEKGKDVLLIIDDLEKLDGEDSDKVFFENYSQLTLPAVKVIYTFPLEAYYYDKFRNISNLYEILFIPPVNLVDAEQNVVIGSRPGLRNLILQRIDRKLIDEDALNQLIDMSGGLLRDLVKFMQDACMKAILAKKDLIDVDVANHAINGLVNDYRRLFNPAEYGSQVDSLLSGQEKEDHDGLVYLLRHLFVLEYRDENDNLWYDAHPCLVKARE